MSPIIPVILCFFLAGQGQAFGWANEYMCQYPNPPWQLYSGNPVPSDSIKSAYNSATCRYQPIAGKWIKKRLEDCSKSELRALDPKFDIRKKVARKHVILTNGYEKNPKSKQSKKRFASSSRMEAKQQEICLLFKNGKSGDCGVFCGCFEPDIITPPKLKPQPKPIIPIIPKLKVQEDFNSKAKRL